MAASISDGLRQKIQAGNIATRLMKHFNGELELSKTQVTVGIALLKKVIPDLANTTISLDPDANKLHIEIVKFSDIHKS